MPIPHMHHPPNAIYKVELATYQPRGLPMGFDHSPKPLTVDFVKLYGLDTAITTIFTVLSTPSLPL